MFQNKKQMRILTAAVAVIACIGFLLISGCSRRRIVCRAQVEVTGQKQCWDPNGAPEMLPTCEKAAKGQDGFEQAGVLYPKPRFRDNGDGTITDNLTGLIWLKQADCSRRDRLSWGEALNWANQLEHGKCGLTDKSSAGDWRLPNIKELQSLVDFGFYRPALTDRHGASQCTERDCALSGVRGTEAQIYWSSTTDMSILRGECQLIKAWCLDLNRGTTITQFKSQLPRRLALAVRKQAHPSGAPAPVEVTGQTKCWDPDGTAREIDCASIEAKGQDGAVQAGVRCSGARFCDNGNGTVTDNLTGLVWLKNANTFGAGKTWPKALTLVNAMEHGKYGLADHSSKGDWRLPNVKELQSLFDFGIISTVTLPNGHPFDNVQNNPYWSSTTVADSARWEYAWTVSGRGLTHYNPQEDNPDEPGRATKTNEELNRRVWAVRAWQVRDGHPCR